MSKTHPPLVLKNLLINAFVELLDIPLAAKTARARNRVLNRITPHAKAFEEARLALIEKWGEKDPATGKPILMPNNHFKLTDEEGFNKDWEELRNTEISIAVEGEEMVDFHLVKDIFLNLETPMNVETTTSYELICQALEKVS